jgi:AmmeMemoRadiSam system protein A
VLTEHQRRELVDVARRSVSARVAGGEAILTGPVDLPHAFGVFVTIKRGGQLRGCLGTLEHLQELTGEVARCAADAASEDPRFSPVTVQELAELTVQVSVLGPLERLDPPVPDQITIGRHGLVIEQGRHRGVLLPQVATELRWTAEQFLRQACVKANLAPDAWQHGAIVYRFEAEVFGD